MTAAQPRRRIRYVDMRLCGREEIALEGAARRLYRKAMVPGVMNEAQAFRALAYAEGATRGVAKSWLTGHIVGKCEQNILAYVYAELAATITERIERAV